MSVQRWDGLVRDGLWEIRGVSTGCCNRARIISSLILCVGMTQFGWDFYVVRTYQSHWLHWECGRGLIELEALNRECISMYSFSTSEISLLTTWGIEGIFFHLDLWPLWLYIGRVTYTLSFEVFHWSWLERIGLLFPTSWIPTGKQTPVHGIHV